MKQLVAKKNLFQLLTNNTDAKEDNIYVSKDEYIHSIINDIAQLLNTRCVFPKKYWRTHLPLNYGLPYFWGMHEPDDLMNPDKQESWKNTLTQTLRYFEPRIKRLNVKVIDANTQTQTLNIEISGEVIIQQLPHKVSFPLSVKNLYTQ